MDFACWLALPILNESSIARAGGRCAGMGGKMVSFVSSHCCCCPPCSNLSVAQRIESELSLHRKRQRCFLFCMIHVSICNYLNGQNKTKQIERISNRIFSSKHAFFSNDLLNWWRFVNIVREMGWRGVCVPHVLWIWPIHRCVIGRMCAVFIRFVIAKYMPAFTHSTRSEHLIQSYLSPICLAYSLNRELGWLNGDSPLKLHHIARNCQSRQEPQLSVVIADLAAHTHMRISTFRCSVVVLRLAF